MKNVSYIVGAVSGVVAVFVLWLIARKKAEKSGNKGDFYDERQVFIRYKAGYITFLVGLFYFLFVSLIYTVDDSIEFNPGIAMLLGVEIMSILFSSICIWNDSYNYEKSPFIKRAAWSFIASIVWIVSFFCYFRKQDTGMAVIYLMVGVLCLSVFINLTLKRLFDFIKAKKEVEEE